MDANQAESMLQEFIAKGFKMSDLAKAAKNLKSKGLLKSGRGKAPSDDPVRNAIRDLVVASTITYKDKAGVEHTSTILDAVNKGLGEGEDKAGSYLVTLNNQFQLNFIVKKPKVKKEKKVGTASTDKVEKQMDEPAVA